MSEFQTEIQLEIKYHTGIQKHLNTRPGFKWRDKLHKFLIFELLTPKSLIFRSALYSHLSAEGWLCEFLSFIFKLRNSTKLFKNDPLLFCFLQVLNYRGTGVSLCRPFSLWTQGPLSHNRYRVDKC